MYTGPNIADDGLILSLDAANVKSYVSGSTIWNNLTTRGNTGTLINGPTYDSSNCGSIVFDGGNDYVLMNNTNAVYSSLTFTAFINRSSMVTPGAGIIFNRGNGGLATGMNIVYPGGTATGIGYHWNDDINTYNYNPNIPIPINTWCYCCVSVSPTTAIFQVNDNVLVRSYTNITPNVTFGGNLMIGADAAISRFYPVKIAYASIYNRALSQAEMFQNYEGLKSRYGL